MLERLLFFNRLGEIRDCSFEQQRYRASGLNLVTAAVVLWNTVYLERAAHAMRGNGHDFPSVCQRCDSGFLVQTSVMWSFWLIFSVRVFNSTTAPPALSALRISNETNLAYPVDCQFPPTAV